MVHYVREATSATLGTLWRSRSAEVAHTRQQEEDSFSLFRTRSENIANIVNGVAPASTNYNDDARKSISEEIPALRYFDALKGPELEILKHDEDTLLPLDQTWAFLLRFPINSFGICLGLGSQAILWKLLYTIPSMQFLHIPNFLPLTIWILALTSLLLVFSTYTLKCAFYFEAVKREYNHPVRVNFFFAPWISCLFLIIGVPLSIGTTIHSSLFWAFMAPITMLEIKIYGQWLSGGERRLSKVANPSLHLSIVGNFVGAVVGALAGMKEVATFFWSVGVAHYLVLFVTLYQRLPTNESLPRELHPVFFLFIAAPSTASIAWVAIHGSFDNMSRVSYFVALFLFTSLIVRINFFRGFRFTISWWAYTFPTTALSIATVNYAEEVTNRFTTGLAIILSFSSSMGVLALLILTILHGFWWQSLFPNDMAIAITPIRKTESKHRSLETT